MKLIARIFGVFLFILFFGFALKNTDEVTLRLFFDNEWRMPLALLLLSFLVIGAVLGILAMTPTVFRKRRQLARSRKALELLKKETEASQAALIRGPQPDGVTNP